MITVSIGDIEKSFSSRASVDEAWINRPFQEQKRDMGRAPCVKVHIPSLGLHFASAACRSGGGGGGGGGFSPAQQSIVAIWRDLGIDERLSGGIIVEFVKRVFRHLA